MGSGAPGWICYSLGPVSWGCEQAARQVAAYHAPRSWAPTRAPRARRTHGRHVVDVKWDVNERVGLNFDVQWIDSNVVNFDNSM
jgi:hypothetical protein